MGDYNHKSTIPRPEDLVPMSSSLTSRLYANKLDHFSSGAESSARVPPLALPMHSPRSKKNGKGTNLVPRKPGHGQTSTRRPYKRGVGTSRPNGTSNGRLPTLSGGNNMGDENSLGSQSARTHNEPSPPVALVSEEAPTRKTLLQKADTFKSFIESLEANVDEGDAEHGVNLQDRLLMGENFLYLRQLRNPYDLKIITHDAINPLDYFTLSEAGLTHIINGDADFTYIEQFEREYYLFSMVTQLPFFKKYRQWKCFLEWKKNVRWRKMTQCKRALQRDLFILNPLLRDNLVALRGKCYRVTSCQLYLIDHTQTYTLAEFCKRQESQKDNIASLLEDFSGKVSEIVYKACEEALREFLDNNGFSAMPGNEDVGSRSIGGDQSVSGGYRAYLNVDDLPTVGSEASPREITFTERAAMRTQCRKLTKYVRLADFFVVDAFLSLAIGSTESFLQYIQDAKASSDNANQDSSNAGGAGAQMSMTDLSLSMGMDRHGDTGTQKTNTCPLFQVEMNFDDKDEGGLEFLPKDDDFKIRLESVIFDALKVVTCPQRLLTHSSFRPFVQPSIDEHGPLGDGIDLEMMIVEDRHFQKMVEDINENVTEAFERSEEYAEIFNPFRDKYLENCHFLQCTEDFRAYRDKSVDDLKAIIAKYLSQQTEFEQIPDIADVGIIRIDSEKLNQQFKPSPTMCLERLYQLVPNVASVKTQELLDHLSRSLEHIGSLPTSVEDFVRLMSHLATTTEEVPELDQRYFFLQDLFGLLDEYSIEMSDADKTNQFMLAQTQAQLKTSMQLTEDSIEENTQRFSKELDENIPKLHAKVAEIRLNLDKPLLRSVESEISVVLRYISKCQGEVDEQVALAKKYCYYQEVLKVPVSIFEELEELKADMSLKSQFWHSLNSFSDLTRAWTDAPFADVDTETLEREVQTYYKTSIQAERGLPGNMAVPKLRAMVEDFKSTLPVVINLRNAALKDRHWDEIHVALGFEVNGVEGFTLGELIDNRAMDASEAISRVTTEAMQESVLEELLGKVESVWEESDFELTMYKEQRDVFIVGGVDEIIAKLDDSLVTLNTIMSSRFVKAILENVESWQKKLAVFQETLDEWMTCQRNWMYLETIFSAPDIQRQLPNESKMFFNVDSSWKEIMKRTNDNPNCIKAGTHAGLLDTFVKHNVALDKIQKSLEDYLETKRMAFPRFYFLSNDELLEILAQTKDPQAVQPHLRKCFDNLVRLDFGDQAGSCDILAMMSGEGEKVPLGRHLKARGNVEDWLTAVQNNMEASLHKAMKLCLSDYSAETRKSWVLQHPGQCIASCAQMAWATGCEDALLSENSVVDMEAWLQQNIRQLSELTILVRSKLTSLQRKVIVALVTTDVHARDIVDELFSDKVDSITNFKWQQQLRYYWEKDLDDVLVRQSNSAIHYGYEYMGATSRLVITPLTDRCWMTITGSFDLKLGASPAGPAGTGKTESSKDLAKALAIQCIVFNCSDQIDYKMMAKLFSGLSQCGCWTCLDEFNRIDIEVLSVIAQQLTVLRQARLSEVERTFFEGRDIQVQDHHVIVTMNPGYAGRTELPDNLKVCFRPVSMMVPDYGLIAEIMLFAEGFEDAKALSRKMTKLYKLSSEQLSQQPHYDFGMRAVKSVLVMAGSLKRAEPDLGEDVVLIRAMRDANVPKFLSHDLPLFYAIISDLFPRVEVPYQDYGALQDAIESELQKANLQIGLDWQKKVIQLFETFCVRFGVVVVGPTGSGKTSAYQTLQKALTTLCESGNPDSRYQKVRTDVLNPKCITMGELYGEFNEMTQEWKDGLASTIMRNSVADPTPDGKWTVFDGPIDALWIENMNTVLDDNMTLCLANGERIKLKSEMRMLFEVQDLEVASPATVSRLGVVYFTPSDLGWVPFMKSWLPKALPKGTLQVAINRIENHFMTLVQPGLDFLRRSCKEPVTTVDINLVTSLCTLFTVMMQEGADISKGGMEMSTVAEKEQCKFVDRVFVFSYVWSMGVSINCDHMPSFDTFFREILDEKGVQDIGLPGGGTVYDYYVDIAQMSGVENVTPEVKKLGQFKNWNDVVQKFEYNDEVPYFRMLVPTIDTTRYSFVIEKCIQSMKPSFLTGETGTGKTVILQNLLQRLMPPVDEGGQGVVPLVINFSAQTRSEVTQSTIESKLEKKRKTLLGAPAGKKVVLYIDDVNMPAVETYGAQAPIELLRQFLDFNGFYDRAKLFWKDIADTVLMVSAAPPGGGRAAITPRFVRHFNVLCLPPSGESAMVLIFSSILGGFLGKFEGEVKSLCKPIISSTIEVYTRICAELLPTPAKFHYTFNLRDVSKVFQGFLMIKPQNCKIAEVGTKLWIHESQRVFCDRLTNTGDKRWFTELVVELLSRNFQSSWTHSDLFESDTPIMFGDFLKPGADDRVYEQLNDMSKVSKVLDECLEEYNLTHTNQMNLVFFLDAINHISRISRILRQPRGSAMLVGVGGSGKQSLTRLASAMCEYPLHQIEITRGYSSAEFHEDLKTMLISTGVKGQKTVFLFTDTQIVEEGFLEDINNLLNAGEVPNLFPSDEYEKIMGDMRQVVKEVGLPESRDNCAQYFISSIRDNLHIVLCMSPVGDALRVRCRQFPSLINCTTIDWFQEWPRAALQSVAERFLADLECDSEEIRLSVVQMCVEVHTSINENATEFYDRLRRKIYTTPKSYLDLITLYRALLAERREEVGLARKRLEVGVVKLEETNAIVQTLQNELTLLQPVLKQKAEEAEVMMKQVAVDQREAEVVKVRVQADEASVKEQAAQVSEIQADAKKDLDQALPALEAAVKALDALDKKDITEIKAFPKPPPAVQMVMEGVCILLGEKPDWDTAKKVLGHVNLLVELKEFDKDNISPGILKKIKKYTDDPMMAPEAVQRVSKAATSLCLWVHAMDVYSRVAKEVGPKQERLAQMNQMLEDANSVLQTKQAELQQVIDRVKGLEKTLEDTLGEKNRLAQESETTKQRLVRAEKLTTGLADEHIRWKATIEAMNEEMQCLVGDIFVAAASISYYGAFTGDFREKIVLGWMESLRSTNASTGKVPVPCSENYSLTKAIGDPVQIREWQLNGLPADSVSTDNAILVTRGKRWPLMVDPQSQANRWIKATEHKSLQVVKMDNPNLLRSLEQCIRVGNPILIEDIGEVLDPSLEPILNKATFKQGGRTLIRLGDSDVDYDPAFKFYLTTKLSNPHYLPEVCIKVTVINFTVTFSGLEDQLLADVVKLERPDIEERKDSLIQSIAADKKQLKMIEDKILKLLSESTGNILDDEVLINTLAESKITSSIISERLSESEVTEKEINITRDSYRAVAVRGSIIYFVVADLALVDPMYQYSLEYFQKMFTTCIEKADSGHDLETRLANLFDYITFFMYTSICRGLFEAHKIMFSFIICAQILRQKGDISDQYWTLLLRGPGVVDRTNQPPNPDPGRINDNSWDLMNALEASSDEFEGLCTDKWDDWQPWFQSDDPHATPLPGKWDSIGRFKKMLILKALREEKGIFAITDFICHHLGKRFTESPQTTMAQLYLDLDKSTPCVFVLSQGADPTAILLRFAQERGFQEKLHLISLGQGQGPRAEKLMESATSQGHWVLLQNCHLAKSWMPSLEKQVLDFKDNPAKIHDDFRLYLTSFPAQYFPVPVLQNSVKLTNEPPKGLRANLLRSYDMLVSDDLMDSCAKPKEFRKLILGLSFFHGMVQERRKFGPLGWNIRYEFNDSDLETAMAVLKRFLDEQPTIPWDALEYVTGHINYGGRVTDDWDRRCLMSVLRKFYTPDILNDEHKLSTSGKYYAPVFGKLQDYKDYFTQLPSHDDPEIFGMHENANITFERAESQQLLRTVLSLQPRSSGGGGDSPDTIVSTLANTILQNVPEVLDVTTAGETTFILRANGVMDSLATVLGQEVVKFNRLLRKVKSSLVELLKAIRGLVVMSLELDKSYGSFLINQVPESWGAVGFASLKPLGSWVQDLDARIEFMRTWILEGQPSFFPLPVFFFPQGFMTGVLQNHSRKYGIPINAIDFSFDVLTMSTGEITEGPEDGVICGGMFLEGARWDAENSVVVDPKYGEMYSPMPAIHFIPTHNMIPDCTYYACPCYKTTLRQGVLSTTGISTNFVLPVLLRTDRHPDFWVLKGTALLLNLND